MAHHQAFEQRQLSVKEMADLRNHGNRQAVSRGRVQSITADSATVSSASP